MAREARGRELGPDRALVGHALVRIYPMPSGWRGHCECLEEFRAIFRDDVMEQWMAHRDEVARYGTVT